MSGCCRWCVGFIFSLGLTSLFMWLSFRPSQPDISIEKFYISALDKAFNPNHILPHNKTSITFDLKLENTNKDKGIYYDALNLTFYYGSNLSLVGNFTYVDFYQGHKKTAHRKEENVTIDGGRVFWEDALRGVSEGGTVWFKVRFVTAVRYKILGRKTRHHGLNLTGDVEVNDEGKKKRKKGVLLKSRASKEFCYRAPWVMVWAGGVGLLLLLI